MDLRAYWIDRRVYEYVAVNVAPLFGRHDPILIYQMGGVGSSSIRNSLFRCRDPRTRLVLMSHEFFAARNRNPDDIDIEAGLRQHVQREIEFDRRYFNALPVFRKIGLRFREALYSERIYKAFIKHGRPVKVITLVRDPVSANVSLFFQVFGKYAGAGRRPMEFDIEELSRIFIDSYLHARPLTWFDVELKATLGIDVYAFPFPAQTGHSIISADNIDLLILRSELADDIKSCAISAFIGIDGLELVRSNVAAGKTYAACYAAFQERLRLPEALLDDLYDSRYARQFFSADEREQLRARWAGR